MYWVLVILIAPLIWLVKNHPVKSKIKIFNHYSYYIKQYKKAKGDQENKN